MRAMIGCVFLAATVASSSSILCAQTPSIDPPLAGRPAHFSNIVGAYTIRVSAEPIDVPVEEPIVLRVTITGRGPAKYQPDRKQLKLFPDTWSRDYYVEPVPDEDRLLPEEGTWVFMYRLRPKHQRITAIDGIKLAYYQPSNGNAPGRFQSVYADPIAISVKPRPAAPEIRQDLPVRTAPASFYELPDTAEVLTPWPATPSIPAWLVCVVLLAPPIVTVAGVRCWRTLFPGGRERLRRETSLAARRAFQSLQPAGKEPVWVVFGAYLRERLAFPAEEPTPAEVQHFLRKRGVARPIAEKLAAFLGACDAARFAGRGAESAAALKEEAGRLIHALEDDLCAA
jgi:hypothetical protein